MSSIRFLSQRVLGDRVVAAEDLEDVDEDLSEVNDLKIRIYKLQQNGNSVLHLI